MKLYLSPGACSLACHIVLEDMGAKYETETVNLRTGQIQNGTEFTKVNPKGSVPALALDDGQIVTEGAVIMQYLADKAPEKNVLPKAGTMERVRAQEWLNYIATDVHKSFSPLFNDKAPEDFKSVLKEQLGKKFDYLVATLKSQPFLMGANYTAADGYLFTVLNWAPRVGVDLSKWPALLGFQERVLARPAVQSAMKAEGLLK